MSPRNLAARLLDHAARIMPLGQRDWVDAMRAELDYIEDGAAASAFAFGCVRASYARRIEDASTVASIGRWVLGGLAMTWAGFSAAWAALMVKIKTSEGVTPADLGTESGTADTLRFIQDYPGWEIGLVLLFAALLAGGAVQLFRRRPLALPILMMGVGVATTLAFIDARLPDPGANRLVGWDANVLIPIVCLVPVWWLSRRAPGLKPSN